MAKTYEIVSERPHWNAVLVRDLVTGSMVEVSVEFDTTNQEIVREWRSNKHKVSYSLKMSEHDTGCRWLGNTEYVIERCYLTPQAVKGALAVIKRNIKRRKEIVRENSKLPLAQQMAEIVHAHVQHYKADFYWHDRLILADVMRGGFVWQVRTAGTNLLYNRNGFADDCIQRNESGTVWYIYQNGKLEQVTHKQAVEFYNTMGTEEIID